MRVVTSRSGNAGQYCRDIARIVDDGYVPYGQPYMNGDCVYREFVKYEHDDDGFGFDVDEDDGEPQQPFETVDFFEDIEDI